VTIRIDSDFARLRAIPRAINSSRFTASIFSPDVSHPSSFIFVLRMSARREIVRKSCRPSERQRSLSRWCAIYSLAILIPGYKFRANGAGVRNKLIPEGGTSADYRGIGSLNFDRKTPANNAARVHAQGPSQGSVMKEKGRDRPLHGNRRYTESVRGRNKGGKSDGARRLDLRDDKS